MVAPRDLLMRIDFMPRILPIRIKFVAHVVVRFVFRIQLIMHRLTNILTCFDIRQVEGPVDAEMGECD